MPQFIVYFEEVYSKYVEIEAEDAEEATEMFQAGEWNEYEEEIDHSEVQYEGIEVRPVDAPAYFPKTDNP